MTAAPRTVWSAVLVILAAVTAVVIAISWSMLSGMMRLPRSESPSELANLKSTAVDIVVEIQALDERGRISAVLLAPGANAAGYVRTKTPVQISPAHTVRYVMGTQADLVHGAVIDVRGRRESDSPLTIFADRIVVLTGSATVR